MSASANVTDAMVHAFEDAYCKNWEAQRCAPEGTQELGTFFATRAGLSAALSAQPSPGVQDALASELLAHAEGLERMAADDRETGLSIEQAIEDGEGYTPDEATDVAAGLQHDAERGEETAALLRKAATALAARQPVGQVPVCNVEGTWLWSKLMDWCKRMGAAPSSHDELFAIAKEAHALYAAPPEQSVGLGQFRVSVLQSLLRCDDERQRGFISAEEYEVSEIEHQRLLALIDSQAVGNG